MDFLPVQDQQTHYYYYLAVETPEKTQQIIEQLLMIFHIADLKSSDIRKAANMKTSDYEDAIQMVCAQRMKVDFIVTRNIKDFIESKVPAMKPDELLERI